MRFQVKKIMPNLMQETQTLFECRGHITLKATAEYSKPTLHFHQKVSQKHKKIKI